MAAYFEHLEFGIWVSSGTEIKGQVTLCTSGCNCDFTGHLYLKTYLHLKLLFPFIFHISFHSFLFPDSRNSHLDLIKHSIIAPTKTEICSTKSRRNLASKIHYHCCTEPPAAVNSGQLNSTMSDIHKPKSIGNPTKRSELASTKQQSRCNVSILKSLLSKYPE